MGVKKKLLKTESQPLKGWSDFGRKEKKFEELTVPSLLSSSFQTSVACLVKHHKLLGGEKRRLLPGSALGRAGEHTGSVKAPAWLHRELNCREQVRSRSEPQTMPLLHSSQGCTPIGKIHSICNGQSVIPYVFLCSSVLAELGEKC